MESDTDSDGDRAYDDGKFFVKRAPPSSQRREFDRDTMDRDGPASRGFVPKSTGFGSPINSKRRGDENYVDRRQVDNWARNQRNESRNYSDDSDMDRRADRGGSWKKAESVDNRQSYTVDSRSNRDVREQHHADPYPDYGYDMFDENGIEIDPDRNNDPRSFRRDLRDDYRRDDYRENPRSGYRSGPRDDGRDDYKRNPRDEPRNEYRRDSRDEYKPRPKQGWTSASTADVSRDSDRSLRDDIPVAKAVPTNARSNTRGREHDDYEIEEDLEIDAGRQGSDRYNKQYDRGLPRKSGKTGGSDDGAYVSATAGTALTQSNTTSRMNSDDAFMKKYGPATANINPPTSDKDVSYVQSTTPSPLSFVMVAPTKGTGRNAMVQCLIIREKESLNPLNMTKFYPSYQLIVQETNKVILLAKKMHMNRTSNYHLFDMTRGHVGSNLSKKSGNYIGKLRARNFQRTEYSLLTQNDEVKEEIAGIMFDRFGIVDQLKEGTQPRKISVIVPSLDRDNVPKPYCTTNTSAGELDDGPSMVDMLKTSEYYNMHVFESKDPVYEKGNYRLNFNGRVTVPSVKNFQLVPPTNINNITCQFGKVGADRFHLDYKAPLNAIQAFSLALCQFNI